MDSHGKGRVKERESMAVYEALGRVCWQPPRAQYRTKVKGGTDIFGVGDYLVVGHNMACMVQVCAQKSAARHRRAVDAWNDKHGQVLYCILEVY